MHEAALDAQRTVLKARVGALESKCALAAESAGSDASETERQLRGEIASAEAAAANIEAQHATVVLTSAAVAAARGEAATASEALAEGVSAAASVGTSFEASADATNDASGGASASPDARAASSLKARE